MLVWTALKGEKKILKIELMCRFFSPFSHKFILEELGVKRDNCFRWHFYKLSSPKKFVQNFLQSTSAHLSRFQRGWSCFVFFSKKSPTRFILSIKRAKNNVGTKVSFIFFCTSFKVLQLAWVVLHKCTC